MTTEKKPAAKKAAKKKATVKNADFKSSKLAKAISAKRFEMGLTTTDAAAEIGISRSGLQGVENTGMTTVVYLPWICNWLGVSVIEFYK